MGAWDCPLLNNEWFQKISILPPPPHRRDWKLRGGGGSQRPKNLKQRIKLNWNFQRGGGSLGKSFPWGGGGGGGVWIFSGTTQYKIRQDFGKTIHFYIATFQPSF